MPPIPILRLAAVLALVAIPFALAAQQQADPTLVEAARGTAGVVHPFAMLAPVGIDPFLALGLFGLGVFLSGGSLAPPLEFLPQPPIWIGLLVLALLLKLGRSFKLTKPLAEIAGTTESVAGVMTLVAMFMTTQPFAADPEAAGAGGVAGAGATFGALGTAFGALGGGGAHEASVLTSALLLAAAVTGLMAVIVVRMGFDLLTWLSPVPFIDALLQFAKLVATALLVAVAVLSPTLAIVLNVVLLAVTVLAARWLLRMTRFATHLLWDALFGRLGRTPLPLKEQELGPVEAIAIRSECGLPKLGRVQVRWTPGGWSAWAQGKGRGNAGDGAVWLGPSTESTLDRGLFGTSLRTPRAHLLLTARYHRHLEVIATRSGTVMVVKGQGLAVPQAGRT